MKPRNMPARKALRQARAKTRAEGRPQPEQLPEAPRDIRFRFGKGHRDASGRVVSMPKVKQFHATDHPLKRLR